MKVFTLAAGFAAGYVLGSRAGRDKYEQIVAATRKAQNHPAVGQVQDKVKRLVGSVSTASSSDAGAGMGTAPAAAGAALKPRSSRRRAPSSVTIPDVAIDPLA